MTSHRNEQMIDRRATLKRRQEQEREDLRQRQSRQTSALTAIDRAKERVELAQGELARELEKAVPLFDGDIEELAETAGIPKRDVQAALKGRKEISARMAKLAFPSPAAAPASGESQDAEPEPADA
ncbi:hypothetical protein ACFVUY_38855 [Kitasatospora sp. NPDC058063]|uniref:hypothetical protein n=1 Tax=unclassified Kitasatospora TaxID=2633591 RepID=UPI0035DD163C